MKKLYYRIKLFFGKRSAQDSLIEFISDEKNVQKAVEGSMQKRLDLFERTKLRKKSA